MWEGHRPVRAGLVGLKALLQSIIYSKSYKHKGVLFIFLSYLLTDMSNVLSPTQQI